MRKLVIPKSMAPSIAVHGFARFAVIVGMAVSSTGRTEPTKPIEMDKVVVAESKTHTLFMGADIFVKEDKELYPVRDVSGGSWVVNVNGQTTIISAKEGPVEIKVSPLLKLTEVSATVSNLKDERAYSFNNDPRTRLTRTLSEAARTNADYQASVSNPPTT